MSIIYLKRDATSGNKQKKYFFITCFKYMLSGHLKVVTKFISIKEFKISWNDGFSSEKHN